MFFAMPVTVAVSVLAGMWHHVPKSDRYIDALMLG